MNTAEQLDLMDKLIMEAEDAIRDLKFLAASEEGDKAHIYHMIRYQKELYNKLRTMRLHFAPYPP
jgi:hypothetical protein